MPTAVSLFSNCGAGDVGYRQSQFEFEVMAELEAKRLDVCLRNHPGAIGIPHDLRNTWPQVVDAWRQRQGQRARPDLLCACPPCQGMSSARAGLGNHHDPENWSIDERNLLVEVVAQVVTSLSPRMIVLENVPQFLTKFVMHPDTGEGIPAPMLLLERIGAEYEAFPVVVDLASYGVPQTRKRTFITLIHREEPCLHNLEQLGVIPFPAITHANERRVTFGQHLAPYRLSALDPLTPNGAADPNDPLHAVPVWNRAEDRRHAMVQATAVNGGSAWHNKTCSQGCNNEDEIIDENDALCPQCGSPLLRPVVWDEGLGGWRLINGFRNSSYRRMNENQVASTITTASAHLGSDINIHPTEHRVLSVRECALLQTFPDDFDWGETLRNRHLNKIREMIGEAVPPLFTQAHGAVLNHLLNGHVDPNTLMSIHNRHSVRARQKLNLPLNGQVHRQNDAPMIET